MQDERRWSAAIAFGHPLFCAALVLLVLNDHVLKPCWPGAITGKLSDVAGLIVAPAVLAWILRVRGERGWLAAHALVCVVFAALEVSTTLTHAIDVGSSALGVPMRMWADPTDLLALPALAISYVSFGPRSGAARVSRSAHWIGAFALLACAATSQNSTPPVRYPFHPGGRVETDAYVRHMGTADLNLNVQRLKDEVQVDCDELMEAPQRVLDGDDFTEQHAWVLARGDAVPLWDRFHDAPERECYAVRLESAGVTWLLAWRHGTPPLREIEIRTEDAERPEEGAIVVRAGEERPRVPPGITVRRL